MATWQKVITSGSAAELAHVTASGGFNSPGTASFGDITGTISTATQAKVDHDSLLNFVANEHIDHSGVTITAGTGLTGGGTIAATRTLNVIGGDGITANANDIAITPAQTTITSIYATDLKIGEDAQTAIDFETANEIHLDADNAEVVNVRAGGIEVTGDVTASIGVTAPTGSINHLMNVVTINNDSNVNANLDFSSAGLLNLRSSNSTTHALELFGGTNGSAIPHINTQTHETLGILVDDVTVMNLQKNKAVTLAGDVSASGIVSASGFTTPLGTVTAFSGAFSSVSASGTTFATIGTATQAVIDHDSLANFVANEHIDHSAVSVVAGTGLTGGGTIAANRTLNVIGGDGITANANDMAITAAQTTITSIKNASLEVGRDNDNSIKFGEDNQIGFRIAATDNVHIMNGKGFITGDVTASGGVTASFIQTPLSPAAALGPGTGSFGHITGSFKGDGSGLTGIAAASVDIDTLTAFSGVPHATQDEFLISDNGTELRATMTMVANGAFALVTGDIGIAEGGAATLGTVGANHIDEISNLTAGEGAQLENINSVTISNTQWGYLGALDQAVQTDSNVQFNNVNVDGNLVVAGTASFEETANLNVKDRFISLASGSAAGGDGGIVVNQALGNVPSGSAFGYEAGTADRWAVQANFVPTGSAMVPDAYMGIVTFSTNAPTGNPQYGGANYGYGNIHVDTDDGEIYIFA